MILGHLIIGILVGIVACLVIAWHIGASPWLLLAGYSGGGSVGLIVSATIQWIRRK